MDRLSRQGEEALGRIAEELVANPVVSGAIGRALEARERAVLAQEAAMGALNLPSAADIERLTRRLRSVSQRLEGIEDALDRLEDKATAAAAAARESGNGGSEELSKRLDEIAIRPLAAARGRGPRGRAGAAGAGTPDGHRRKLASASQAASPRRTPSCS